MIMSPAEGHISDARDKKAFLKKYRNTYLALMILIAISLELARLSLIADQRSLH